MSVGATLVVALIKGQAQGLPLQKNKSTLLDNILLTIQIIGKQTETTQRILKIK